MRIVLGFLLAPLTGYLIFAILVALGARQLELQLMIHKAVGSIYLPLAYIGTGLLGVPYFLIKRHKLLAQNKNESRRSCILTGAILGVATLSLLFLAILVGSVIRDYATPWGHGARYMSAGIGMTIIAILFSVPLSAGPGALCGWSFWAIARPYKRDAVLKESGSVS